MLDQEAAIAAYRKRQKAQTKKPKSIRFIYTPDEGEDFEKIKKKAIWSKFLRSFDDFYNTWYFFSGKSIFAQRIKQPKANQEDEAASSSEEENKDAPDAEPTLNLEQLPDDIKTAISTAQAKLESGELQEAKDALG